MISKNRSTRRSFLKTAGQTSAYVGAAVTMPAIVPSYVLGQDAPSEKLTVGIIGLGWRGNDLINGCRRNPHIQVAAISDLDRPYLLRAQKIFDDEYEVNRELITGSGGSMKRAEMPEKAVEAYAEYERLLDRKDIDAVLIAVPDHWHAKLYIDAMLAGKDVYGEKPLSLTLNQGRNIVRVARSTGRVFQTGSQQRSDDKFRMACEYVRSGRLGKITHVDVRVGGAPQQEGVPNEPIPDGLNWEKLLGPAALVPYNPLRCHVTFRWFFEYSGGMVTDWGAHHLDIMQWGLGMDGSGPLSVEGTAAVKPGVYNTFTSFDFTFEYPNDIKVYFNSKGGNGVTFHGPKGSIFVSRGQIKSDPEDLLKEPLTASDVHLYKSNDHLQNWVDCVKTRELPITDVEIGHRSVSVCHLANICGHMKRKLYWDAKNELFINDIAANRMLSCEERAPYQHMG
ncbi:MAG: Gfo/Idh/MocA family oxidoreductase [bacterium]|jgi:predicted dehydrogenase|nr:Gfo/Idh/MocA family oxidoreductase [bacterium]